MKLLETMRHGQSVNSENVQDPNEYDPYRLLAAEIVISAVEDWRQLIYEREWETPSMKRGYGFDSIRWFFRSGWCGLLMQNFNTTPEVILKLLEQELEDAKNASGEQLKKIRRQHRVSKRGVAYERIRQRDCSDNHKGKGNK